MTQEAMNYQRGGDIAGLSFPAFWNAAVVPGGAGIIERGNIGAAGQNCCDHGHGTVSPNWRHCASSPRSEQEIPRSDRVSKEYGATMLITSRRCLSLS